MCNKVTRNGRARLRTESCEIVRDNPENGGLFFGVERVVRVVRDAIFFLLCMLLSVAFIMSEVSIGSACTRVMAIWNCFVS